MDLLQSPQSSFGLKKSGSQIWVNLKKKIQTSKNGLHAESTTLWAFRHFPSAANVQSTSVPFSNSVSKTATRVD
jgi:hypothetical protein